MQYQLLPDLQPDEYEALRTDIALRGVQVPVEYDEQGNILDGHHRVRICQELGITDWPRIVRQGLTENEKIEHVLSLNLNRRHLTREQRIELVRKLREQGWSTRRIAEVIGVGHMTVTRDLDNTDDAPVPIDTPASPTHTIGADGKRYPIQPEAIEQRRELVRKLHEEGMSTRRIAEVIEVDQATVVRDLAAGARQQPSPARRANDRERKSPELIAQYPGIEIRRGDFREVLTDVPDRSVKLILSDPPYGKQFLSLWDDLGSFARRILRPDGLLITYSGQLYLPQVIAALSRHLTWWWLGGVLHAGHGNLTPLGYPVRKVINQFKPLLMFIPPDGTGIDVVFRDFIHGAGPEKDKHNWQQPIAEAIEIMTNFCQPGDLVIDPFAGSGTVGAAAQQLGLHFIGAEILDGRQNEEPERL